MITGLDCLLVLSGEDLSKFPRSSTAAERYRALGCETPIITTGKGGRDKETPESLVMKEYLFRHGVRERDVHCETESLNTLANFVYSQPLLKGLDAKRIGVVTEPFHMSRALRTGRRVLGVQYVLEQVVSGGRKYSAFSFAKEWAVIAALGFDVRKIRGGNVWEFKEYLKTAHPFHGSDPRGAYSFFTKLWNSNNYARRKCSE